MFKQYSEKLFSLVRRSKNISRNSVVQHYETVQTIVAISVSRLSFSAYLKIFERQGKALKTVWIEGFS